MNNQKWIHCTSFHERLSEDTDQIWQVFDQRLLQQQQNLADFFIWSRNFDFFPWNERSNENLKIYWISKWDLYWRKHVIIQTLSICWDSSTFPIKWIKSLASTCKKINNLRLPKGLHELWFPINMTNPEIERNIYIRCKSA